MTELTLDIKTIIAFVTLLSAWSAVSIWAIKSMIASQLQAHREYTDEKFKSLAKLLSAQADEIKKFERDLMQLKIDLPNTYVRREDWIRTATTIDAKMDAMREAITNTNLRVENVSEKLTQLIVKEENE